MGREAPTSHGGLGAEHRCCFWGAGLGFPPTTRLSQRLAQRLPLQRGAQGFPLPEGGPTCSAVCAAHTLSVTLPDGGLRLAKHRSAGNS